MPQGPQGPFTATPGSFTPINMWAMLRMLINQNTPLLNNAGPPVNGTLGTFAGQAGPGALLIDFVSVPPQLYINQGTLLSPNWSKEIASLPGVVQYLPFVNTGLFAELFNEGVVASGSSPNTATQLTGAINRVTSGSGGVALPPAVGGLDIIVINHSGVDITVFGSPLTNDTINDIPAGIGVNLMNDSFALFASTGGGRWYSADLATGYSRVTGLATLSYAANVVAAGTNQSTATQLTKMMNRVSTVPLGTGVALPVATPGEFVAIDNRSTSVLQVYGNPAFPGDTINLGVSTVGVVQPANTIVTYYCFVANNWEFSFIGDLRVPWLPLSANTVIPVASQYWMITKGSIFSGTIVAPPASPVGDGIYITISSDTPFAHSITFTGNTLDSGSNAVSMITFNANKGAEFGVVSYNGRWKLVSQIGSTPS